MMILTLTRKEAGLSPSILSSVTTVPAGSTSQIVMSAPSVGASISGPGNETISITLSKLYTPQFISCNSNSATRDQLAYSYLLIRNYTIRWLGNEVLYLIIVAKTVLDHIAREPNLI